MTICFQILLLCLAVFSAPLTFADDAKKPTDQTSEAPIPTAVVWYMEMAKSGDADAQYNLGSVYETGFGVKADILEAVDWYQKAAEQDHQLAQLKLGILYVLGDGVRQSIIKGTNWIHSASENGNKFAGELYARVLSPDVILDTTADEIIKKVRPFIDLGEKKSIAKLDAILTRQKKKAKQKEPELAERFTGPAKNTLGKEVEVSNEVPDFLDNKNTASRNLEDDNIAFLQREANAGNLEAQYQLGRMYDIGDKLERDPQKAITWYTSAANQGYDEAQYRLALIYLYGMGTTRNTSKGEALLTQAAKQNHPVAREMLPIYLANRSANSSTSIALSWYLEKVAEGNPDGSFGVGYMYENGWGLNPSEGEAKKWYSSARTTGSGSAAKRLRQIKATAAANAPDPSVESRPKLPENFQPRASESPSVASQSASVSQPVESVPITRTASPSLSPQPQTSRPGNTESDSPVIISATITRRSPLTPVILVLFGIVMGITVFKWMRRSSYKNTMF
jgi:TPR repeat protein